VSYTAAEGPAHLVPIFSSSDDHGRDRVAPKWNLETRDLESRMSVGHGRFPRSLEAHMRMLRLLPLFSVLFLTVPCKGNAQDTLEGPWVMTINSPLGPVEFPITIVQEGEELSVSTPPGPNGTFTFAGSVEGSRVRFEMETEYEGAAMPITLTGGIRDTRMEGPADFGGLAMGDWNAVRSEDD
jgi:hypothetical protein